ncbi:MAG: hypothetical protein M1827_002119 [Pycnora praestabilis]|nr:MAG: hypothetical protein M1827_002119 [Pycnora praestabilis]
MAPSNTPRRKNREANYLNVGVQGRKTGITVKDTGVRDENGLEVVDGLFSSPEKSPVKHNGVTNNTTVTSEEDMDFGQTVQLGTIPEPTDVLNGQRMSRNGRTVLPPPRSRSPMKTSLNSPARRMSSMGPISSPLKRTNEAPTRATSHPAVNRRLDFSMDDAHPSIESSPPTALKRSAQQGRQFKVVSGSETKRLSGISDVRVQPSPMRGKRRGLVQSIQAKDLNDEEDEAEEDELEENGQNSFAQTNGNINEEDLPNGDDSLQIVQEDPDEDLYQDEVPTRGFEDVEVADSQPRKRRGRPKKGAITETTDAETIIPSKKPGKRLLKSSKVPATEPEVPEVEIEESQPVVRATKRKGRPPKAPVAPIQEDEAVEEEEEEQDMVDERPTKRLRKSLTASTPITSKSKMTKPPPSKRDPNAKITSAKKNAIADIAEAQVARKGSAKPTKPRSLFLLRRETPVDDAGALMTRSGRTSVKPLAYWRNERIVFGEGDSRVGEDYLLPSIKEIIRTEEIEQPRRTTATRRPKKAGRRRELSVLEEEEDLEPWETEVGIVSGEVKQWDQSIDDGDDIAANEIAYSSTAIETREVANSTFRYAKTLTFPFFGSGMVDLPPGGEKKRKNSRKMQMVFFVFYGKVLVRVADTEFRIGKGGMWQVPRGNFYSITNDYERPARIFFAQGCELAASDLPGNDSGPA